jgi:carbamoyl-phosphate synthase small subunit
LTNAPAFGFQGHPEASPGPHDISGLFDRFIRAIESPESAHNVTVLREA